MLHIKRENSNFTICYIKIEKIRCRPRTGSCNLLKGHKGRHNNVCALDSKMIEIATLKDSDDKICSTCLVDSF